VIERAQRYADDSWEADRRDHFRQVFGPKFPELARVEIDELFPDGVWSPPRDMRLIGEVLRSVLDWDGGRRYIMASTGRGKTLALTYCGLRWINHYDYPQAADYITTVALQDREYKPPRHAATIPLLVLDECHRIPQLDHWVRTNLYGIIDRRVNAGLVTLSAGTRAEGWMREKLGDEWMDRLAIGDEITTIRDSRNWRRT
jgi:hypothetical protein